MRHSKQGPFTFFNESSLAEKTSWRNQQFETFIRKNKLHKKGGPGKQHLGRNKQPATPTQHNDKIGTTDIYTKASHTDLRKERSQQCKTVVEKIRPIYQNDP